MFSFVLNLEIMARTKAYREDEVIEKAMNLFWRNGYESTSMSMLEKEMGINKFSIYSSFESKDGLFLECIKCYKAKLEALSVNLNNSANSLEGIKQYFYDFLEFSTENDLRKGCLITNVANEINQNEYPEIVLALGNFTKNVRNLFKDILKRDTSISEEILEQQSDFLLISMFGLSSASRVFSHKQLTNYIENIFKNL